MSIETEPSETIKAFKEKIISQFKIAPDSRPILNFGGEILDDSKTISECDLASESTVHMILEPLKYVFYVQFPPQDCQRITVEVEAKECVKKIKEEIYRECIYKPEDQALYLDGKQLEDDKTLLEYGFKDDLTLELRHEPKPMNVFIKSTDGKVFSVPITHIQLVRELKEAIAKEIGVRVEDQVLTFGGFELNNIFPVSDYDIASESTVQLMIESPPDGFIVWCENPLKKATSYRVSPTMPIKHLRLKVQKEERLADEELVLYESGRELEDKKTFADYNIKDGARININPREIYISVKTMNSHNLKMHLDPYMLGIDLKKRLEKDLEMPVKHQTLVFQTSRIEDDRALQSYGIETDCTVHVITNFIPATIVTPGKNWSLELDPGQTTLTLKSYIKEQTGIKEERQIIIISGQTLPNTKRICDYTSPNCFIYVTTTDAKKIKFSLRVSEDKLIPLEYPPYVAFEKIKEDLETTLNVPKERQAYVMTVDPQANDRTLLENHMRPVEFGMKDGSVMDLRTEDIQLVVKLIPYEEYREYVLLPNDKIGEIKKKILKERTKSRLDDIKLQFKGQILDDDKIPEHYGIKNKDEIEFILRFMINIKTATDDIIFLDVESTDTLKKVKERIFKRKKYAPEDQRLIFCGMDLEDEKTIDDYSIEEGSTVHLIYWFTLQVKCDTGEETEIKVTSFESFKTIKEKVAKKLRIPTDHKRVKLEGRRLKEDKNLEYYYWRYDKPLELVEP